MQQPLRVIAGAGGLVEVSDRLPETRRPESSSCLRGKPPDMNRTQAAELAGHGQPASSDIPVTHQRSGSLWFAVTRACAAVLMNPTSPVAVANTTESRMIRRFILASNVVPVMPSA